MGISPPNGVNESCMALTAPQEAEVVTVAYKAELKTPKRTSLPSMLPPAIAARACTRGFPPLSALQQTSRLAMKRRAMALQTAQPCFLFPAIRPR